MDASHPVTAEQPRPSRVQAGRRSRRPLVIGIFVAAILLLAGLGAGGWYLWQWTENRPPERVVVVGESKLEDGTTVAGLVATVEPSDGSLAITAIDSGEETAIPGTSYNRLRDALTMGGPERIASIVTDGDDATGWIVLDEQAWARLIDDAGGVQVEIPEETTVFTGEQLFRFAKGPKILSGEEAVALVMGADAFETAEAAAQVRVTIGEAVARALTTDSESARETLVGPGVDLSGKTAPIQAFLLQ